MLNVSKRTIVLWDIIKFLKRWFGQQEPSISRQNFTMNVCWTELLLHLHLLSFGRDKKKIVVFEWSCCLSLAVEVYITFLNANQQGKKLWILGIDPEPTISVAKTLIF